MGISERPDWKGRAEEIQKELDAALLQKGELEDQIAQAYSKMGKYAHESLGWEKQDNWTYAFSVGKFIEMVNAKLDEQVRLIGLWRQYVELLGKELQEVAPIAHDRGWRSTRHEEGKKLREQLCLGEYWNESDKRKCLHEVLCHNMKTDKHRCDACDEIIEGRKCAICEIP